jgi:hypothetical protein
LEFIDHRNIFLQLLDLFVFVLQFDLQLSVVLHLVLHALHHLLVAVTLLADLE